MKALLIYAGIPVVIGVLCAVLASARVKDAAARNNVYRNIGIAVAVTAGLFSLLHLLVQSVFASYGEPFPALAVAVTSVSAVAALWPAVCQRQARPRLNRWYRTIGIAAAVCLLVEVFVCNFGSLCTAYKEAEIPLAAVTHSGGVTDSDEGALIIVADSTLTITDECAGATTLGLRFDSNNTPVRIEVSAKDDNFSQKSVKLIERTIATDSGSAYLPLNTYGTLHEVAIRLSNIRDPLTLRAVVFSNALPFTFSCLRFIGGWLIITLMTAVYYGRLYNVAYDRRRRSHQAAVAICLLSAVALPATMLIAQFPLKDTAVTYPLDNAEAHDAYIQQFDAFMKGQLHLDIPVHESLLALDDPYDNSLRTENSDIIYKYDRAYYNGQYYSYFGVTPLLIGYFPYYWITGTLPTSAPMCCIFAIGAVIFLFLCILRFVRFFGGKVSLPLLLLSLITAAFCSGIYWFMLTPSMYNLPLLSGLCFLFMTLWAGLGGCTAKRPVAACLWFILCAVGAVLLVGSRPTMALCCVVLAPAFIHLLVRRDYSLCRKLLSATAFLMPLGLGAAAIMWYNAARFGSPLEFGAVYQLTVSNVAANTFSLSLIPAALYHYLLQPFSVDGQFPPIRPNYSVLSNYGRYVYLEHNIGLLAFPHLLVGTAALPAAARRIKTHPVRSAMVLLTPVIAIVLAVVEFMMGGVTMRYLGDLLAIVTVMAVPVLLWLYRRTAAHIAATHRVFTLFALILAASLVIGVSFTIFTARDSTIVKDHFPQLVAHLEDAVMFWR